MNLGVLRRVRCVCGVARAGFSSETPINSVLGSSGDKRTVRVRGWVKALRKMKDAVFVDVNDGSHAKHLQVVVKKCLVPDDLTFGASVETTGRLSTNANNQVELLCDSVRVVGPCTTERGYPFFPKKSYSDDYTRQFLHLRCRTNRFGSLLRVRHGCRSAVHDFFLKKGYYHIDAPILTSNDCEGAGQVFKVVPADENPVDGEEKENGDESYFDTTTYLTVSGQLHLEAMARCLSNVYTFGPTFRAENSKSRLHLSEFYMVEAESSFMSVPSDIIHNVESLIKESLKTVLDRCIEDIIAYNKFNEEQQGVSDETINKINSRPFTVMSYKEAADVLENKQNDLVTKFTRGSSLTKEQELYLVKRNDNVPIFVVEWPEDVKPFYMKTRGDGCVLALDLLCPNVGEVCGGGVREDDYETLRRRLERLGSVDRLHWYLDLRKFGNVTTGGFGLGFERLLQVFLATPNIKDTIPFPRWPHNCQL